MATLRRTVTKWLGYMASLAGKSSVKFEANIRGAVTVSCKSSVFTFQALQAWLVETLALPTSPLTGQTLVWLPSTDSATEVVVSFTTTVLQAAFQGVQYNSTFTMSAAKLIADLEKVQQAGTYINLGGPVTSTPQPVQQTPAAIQATEVPSHPTAEAMAAAIDQQQSKAEEVVTLANMATTGKGKPKKGKK